MRLHYRVKLKLVCFGNSDAGKVKLNKFLPERDYVTFGSLLS